MDDVYAERAVIAGDRGGRGDRRLPPWVADVGALPGGRVAGVSAVDAAPEHVGSAEAGTATTLDLADFLQKYRTAKWAIITGEWPVPSDNWIAHMIVVASYFPGDLRERVRAGLLLAVRSRTRGGADARHS